MITEETKLVVTDDVTGETIKHGGWALVRLVDLKSFHVQNIADVVRLILHGETPDGSEVFCTGEYVRQRLIESGDIGPVLSEESVRAAIEEDIDAAVEDAINAACDYIPGQARYCVAVGKPRLCGSKECGLGCEFYCESD